MCETADVDHSLSEASVERSCGEAQHHSATAL